MDPIETRIRIEAEDKASIIIDALAGKVVNLDAKLYGINKAFNLTGHESATHLKQMADAFDLIGRKASLINKTADALKQIGTVSKNAVGHVASLAGIAGTGAFVSKSFKVGATLQDEQINMRKAGFSAAAVEDYSAQALAIHEQYKQVSSAEVLHMMKEGMSVLKHRDEIKHLIGPLVNVKAQLDSLDPSGSASEGLMKLVKGAENVGATQDPDRFIKLLDGYMKSMQVAGKTIDPTMIYEAMKYSKMSGNLLSDRFLMTTMLSLSQELSGSTAGNGIAMLGQYINRGWKQSLSGMKELVRAGLVNENDVTYSKTGEVLGVKAGRLNFLKEQSLFRTDPDKWLYQVLVPAMEKQGWTSQEDQLSYIARIFPRSDAGVVFSKLLAQKSAFENHAQQYGDATGLAGYELMKNQASAQLKALGSSFDTFIATASGPLMEPAAKGLATLADALNALTMQSVTNPMMSTVGMTAMGLGGGYLATKTAGWLGSKMFGRIAGSAVVQSGAVPVVLNDVVAATGAGVVEGVAAVTGSTLASTAGIVVGTYLLGRHVLDQEAVKSGIDMKDADDRRKVQESALAARYMNATYDDDRLYEPYEQNFPETLASPPPPQEVSLKVVIDTASGFEARVEELIGDKLVSTRTIVNQAGPGSTGRGMRGKWDVYD